MSKNEDIRNISIRQKNILYLMHRYLNENGFYETAKTLQSEARLSANFEVCDNIDLDSIYLEFATYYNLKFGKYPKFLKKTTSINLSLPGQRLEKANANTLQKSKNISNLSSINKNNQKVLNDLNSAISVPNNSDKLDADNDLQVTVTHLNTSSDADLNSTSRNINDNLADLKQIQHANSASRSDMLLSCQEWQNLAELVRSTIVTEDVKLTWSDMCGNELPMEVIKEAVLIPINYPELFASGLKPWRSVLIHGPPGSGKTLLAKILYAETKNSLTFFNITSSIVVSKWRGESEKLLKILFFLAQKYAPSIIFFDEIEGLTSKRDRITDHESSKRFKNELLQLMDGLDQSNTGVFLLASTNLPWEIDDAFLRRFEKKLLVQLPNEMERATLIRKQLPQCVKTNSEQIHNLVELSNNFTGDEIRLACKEIAMQSIRQFTKLTDPQAKQKDFMMSLDSAFKQIKPLSLTLMEKHIQWQNQYGT